MPDVFEKGKPHRPWSTLGGHYIGMQPVLVPGKPTEVWYRGDDVAELKAELAKTQAFSSKLLACSVQDTGALVASDQSRIEMAHRIADLEAQLAQARAAPVLTEMVRRPPIRAGERHEETKSHPVPRTHAAAEAASQARQIHAGDHGGVQSADPAADAQAPEPRDAVGEAQGTQDAQAGAAQTGHDHGRPPWLT